MKIAIYEPIHLECIFPYCEMLSHRGDQVSICTSAAFKNDLQVVLGEQYAAFEFSFLDMSESRRLFWQKINSFFHSSAFDLIILNSIDFRHLMIYKALQKQEACIVVTLHDINNFFKPKYSWRPKTILRSLGKILLAKKADAFFVYAKAMQEYILSKQYTTKPVFLLPPVITKAQNPRPESPVFVITIPGSIDKKRRDYKLVLECFSKLSTKYSQNIKLFLAGRPVGKYGYEILQTANNLKQKGHSISFYEQEIPENIFRGIIEETTLLWSPLCIDTLVHDRIAETYGVTKMSGNIHDAIRYGKPLMVPDQLRLPEEILSSCVTYTSVSDAQQQLDLLITHKAALQNISLNAFYNSQKYSLANGSSMMKEIFFKLDLQTPDRQRKHEHQPKK